MSASFRWIGLAPKSRGDGRQRRGEDGRVEVLHEQRAGDDERQQDAVGHGREGHGRGISTGGEPQNNGAPGVLVLAR